MEKLTQPYLWCSLGTIEESEPWFMSGLKLSPSFQQTAYHCLGAVPSSGHILQGVDFGQEYRSGFGLNTHDVPR